MFIFLRTKKGQSTLEYGLIIAVVVAVLITTQTYLKRGMQGKMRESADSIGKQFSPGYTKSTESTVSDSNSTERTTGGTQPLTTSTTTSNMTRTETENVAAQDQEYWPK